MVFNSDKSVTLNGVAPSCISEIKTYNAQPNVAVLNAAQGTVAVINSTAIHITGMPNHVTQYLESIATKQN